MAVQTAAYSKTMTEKANELVAHADKWAEGRRNKDGLRFILFPSQSRADVYYMTRFDGNGCTCPAASLSKRAECFHQIAARRVAEDAQERAAKPKVSYEDLFVGDGDQLTDAF